MKRQPKPFGDRRAFITVYPSTASPRVGGSQYLESWSREMREEKERNIRSYHGIAPLYRINLKVPR